MNREAVQDSPEGAVLTIHVQPKASKSEYVGPHGTTLKIRVAAPPVGGTANEALCAYLAERFGIPKSHVTIQAGQTVRRKRVLLKGVTAKRVREAFSLSP